MIRAVVGTVIGAYCIGFTAAASIYHAHPSNLATWVMGGLAGLAAGLLVSALFDRSDK